MMTACDIAAITKPWKIQRRVLVSLFNMKAFPPIATDATAAWSVRLSHSSTLLKPLEGVRCHLTSTHVDQSAFDS